MKNYSLIIALGMLVFFLFSCEEEKKNEVMGTWNTGPITDYTVTPINGGATIEFTIPNDPDILYIMAEYERNGKIFTEKSSIYKNELTLEGFHRVNLVKAKIYKVNRNEERSAPLAIEFEPLESIVDIAQRSLNVEPAFGGLIASWDNPIETELGITMLVEDSIDNTKLNLLDVYYSAMDKDVHPFRGLEPKEAAFAFYIEDKWGNISDTLRLISTPFFETMIPKPYADFRKSVPYDNVSDLGGARVLPALWDNIVNTSAHGWLTQPGNSGLSMTIDLKQVAKLSRFVIHGYHLNAMWGQANASEWELWGIDKFDNTKMADKPYWLDEYSLRNGALEKSGIDPTTVLPDRTFKDDWTYLGLHTLPKQATLDSDTQLSIYNNGMEYTFPVSAKPVRYVRMFVRAITGISPPPANNYWSAGEITFYGDNTVPQN